MPDPNEEVIGADVIAEVFEGADMPDMEAPDEVVETEEPKDEPETGTEEAGEGSSEEAGESEATGEEEEPGGETEGETEEEDGEEAEPDETRPELSAELESVRLMNEALVKQLREQADDQERLRAAYEQQTQTQSQKQQAADCPILAFIPNQDTMDQVLSSPESLNLAFNQLYYSGLQKAEEQSTLRVGQQIQAAIGIQEKRAEFYRKNPDLAPYNEYCSVIVDEVVGQHPDWGIDQVLVETAKTTRQKLKLGKKNKKGQAHRGKSRSTQRPGHVGRAKVPRKQAKDTRTPEQIVFDEMEKD